MKIFTTLAVVILCGFSSTAAQIINLPCRFFFADGLYTCQLIGITIPENQNTNVMITGVHLFGNTNNHVQRVSILFSNVPLVITQLFTTFPFLRNLQIMSGLTRIQSNAFANANHLDHVEIIDNPGLRTIHSNAFFGAPNLRTLDLHRNGIQVIHALAFNGLSSLQAIWLDDNNIQQLPAQVFSPMIILQKVVLDDNLLTSIDGRLFANNMFMLHIDLQRNNINSIQWNFLDRNPHLNSLNMIGNICANNNWIIGRGVTIDTIRQGLTRCFNNFAMAFETDENDQQIEQI